MRRRLPPGNSLVLAVLRSPAHRLLSGLVIELRYTGRRTGRQYVLPVQYARAADRLIVWPQDAPRKTWWRNFEAAQPVTVRLAGQVWPGTARVIDRGDPAWEEARRVYAARWRRLASRLTGPLVEISIRPEA
jgi:deazaflavin-dependent oxidoreductase (nitroreductase family)